MQHEVSTQELSTCLGHQIIAFQNDHIAKKIKAFGLYERENIELMFLLLDQISNPVVFDIGANIGNHTLAFATRAKAVFAFEPIPRIYAVLAQNVANNALKNVTTFQVALSNTNSEGEMFLVDSENVGASSFDRKEHFDTTATQVQLRQGDAVFAETGATQLDFIKLDVEAHEAFVLDGLRDTINRFEPIITMEWSDALTIGRMRELNIIDWLATRYDIFVLGSNYDRGYWAQTPLAYVRRKFTRSFRPKKLALYPFDSARIYKNLVLLPRSKTQSLLRAIRHRVDLSRIQER